MGEMNFKKTFYLTQYIQNIISATCNQCNSYEGDSVPSIFCAKSNEICFSLTFVV